MALPIEKFSREWFERFYDEVSSFNDNFLFSISIGASRPSSSAADVRKSYEEAFLANRALKGTRGLSIKFFDSSLEDKAIESKTILESLNNAFKNNEFFIVIQPIVDSREGKVSMAEALARWRSPTIGIVSPDSFIPFLEKNGMIVELDRVVRSQVYAYLRKRIDASLPTFPISVNVSRAELEHPSFVPNLCRELESAHIPFSLLRLEVTETMLANQGSYFFKNVFLLKNKGFYLEMDDFGSGYSSLLALREIPFDLIKLDMKFFHDDGNGKSLHIVAAAIQLARALGTSIVSEGVEKKETVDFLSSNGAYLIQGYFYSKPLALDSFDEFVANHGVATIPD